MVFGTPLQHPRYSNPLARTPQVLRRAHCSESPTTIFPWKNIYLFYQHFFFSPSFYYSWTSLHITRSVWRFLGQKWSEMTRDEEAVEKRKNDARKQKRRKDKNKFLILIRVGQWPRRRCCSASLPPLSGLPHCISLTTDGSQACLWAARSNGGANERQKTKEDLSFYCENY